ncbi:MAG: DUF3667 domain-containing protein [Sphingomonas sp.]|jgi:hypothetical protein|uniref:DUF3667 domain-containing protein n=1 Tax=Sphingomonas sp. TaxID=28214 RepID=UPI003567064D
MSGGIEAAGDIATGALIGRAVEPHAGEGHAHAGHAHGAEHGMCLNCGTALIGDYCHACGQAEHVHRSLSSIGHDLLHGVFHFEGKIWRTLPMLVAHPGALTRRYIAGERARFVSPLALFLFSVFLLFATIHTFDGELESVETSNQTRPERIAEIDKQLVEANANLKEARANHAKRDQNIPDGELIAAEAVARSLNAARTSLASGKGVNVRSQLTDVKTGWHALDKGIAKANANPGLALYKLQSSAYKFSWALIPISVPFVALMFLWRRRFQLYDHAIFVTYSLAFMMLFVVALTLGGMIGLSAGLITLAVFVVPPVHMFAQLRGAYSLRKRSALWRTIALTWFAFIALTAFTVLLLVMGLME